MFDYKQEQNLCSDEFIDLLYRSTLAERRPVGDKNTIKTMLKNAQIIYTCRNEENKLIGISRAITDFSFCTYLSDLAVDKEYQKQGIGKELIKKTHEAAGINTTLILLAAPKAQTYYGHIGMAQHPSCWINQSIAV